MDITQVEELINGAQILVARLKACLAQIDADRMLLQKATEDCRITKAQLQADKDLLGDVPSAMAALARAKSLFDEATKLRTDTENEKQAWLNQVAQDKQDIQKRRNELEEVAAQAVQVLQDKQALQKEKDTYREAIRQEFIMSLAKK